MSQSSEYTSVQYAPHASALETEGTPYTELAKVQDCSISSENGFIYDRGLSEGLNITNTYYGMFSTTGSVTFEVVDFDFLKHWIGPKSGAGTSVDKYTLTEYTSIGYTSSDLQPFSLEKSNNTESTKSVEVAIGCVGTDFSLSGSIGTPLTCSSNFTARHSLYRATSQTYTPVATNPFIFLGGNFKYGASPTTLPGVRSFSISLTNAFDFDTTRELNSRFIGLVPPSPRDISFEITLRMASALATTIINDFYGSEAGGVYSPEDGSTAISPTDSLQFQVNMVNASRYATIDIDGVTIDSLSVPVSLGGGIVEMSIAGKAKNSTSNKFVQWWTV